MIFKNFYFVIILCLLFLNCKDDDQEEIETFLCCGDNSFSALNVNNLSETSPKVLIPNVFTPNSDGINDTFIIPSLAPYPNHFITIYSLDDKIIYESYKNGVVTVWFDGKNQNTVEEVAYGTYKYKVIIENEQTYVQNGYLCLLRNKSESNGFDFSNCFAPQTIIEADPVLIN